MRFRVDIRAYCPQHVTVHRPLYLGYVLSYYTLIAVVLCTLYSDALEPRLDLCVTLLQQTCTPQQFAIVRHVAIDMNNNMVSKTNRIAAQTLRQLKFEPVRSDEPVLRAELPVDEVRLTIGSLFVDSLGRLVGERATTRTTCGRSASRFGACSGASPRRPASPRTSAASSARTSSLSASASACSTLPLQLQLRARMRTRTRTRRRLRRPRRCRRRSRSRSGSGAQLMLDACRAALHKYGVFELALNAATGELQVLERLESSKADATGSTVAVAPQPPATSDSEGALVSELDPLLTAGTVSVLATASTAATTTADQKQQQQSQLDLSGANASFVPPAGAQLNGGRGVLGGPAGARSDVRARLPSLQPDLPDGGALQRARAHVSRARLSTAGCPASCSLSRCQHQQLARTS